MTVRSRSGSRSRKGASATSASQGAAAAVKPHPLQHLRQQAMPPAAPPPFTAKQVFDAIPAHCFERSILRSLGHIALDMTLLAGIVYTAVTYIPQLPSWATPLGWGAYWWCAGLVMMGLWVLAHECGHGAAFPKRWMNDTAGLILHSALLVPYHSWQISHAQHHANTCSVEHDEVFVPSTRSAYIGHIIDDTPLGNIKGLLTMLLAGWPGYLIANFGGPAKYLGKANSHFNPRSAIFARKQQPLIVLSDVGIAATVAALAYSVSTFGWRAVAAYYGVPYLLVNSFLVIITYLQHTDTFVPHYRESEFTWLRGALSTVDRSWGTLIDAAFHHISDTHVLHHLNAQIPFYHAQEATEAIKKVLGPYYMRDYTPIPVALWRSWRDCRFVEDEGGVVYYKPASEHNETPAAHKKTA